MVSQVQLDVKAFGSADRFILPNMNLADPTRFKLIFLRSPRTEFYCQKINLPEISLGSADVETPRLKYTYAGEKLVYQPFVTTITVDNELKNYIELLDWMKGISENDPTCKETDVDLIIGNNVVVRFYGVFPMNISGIQFSTVETEVTFVTMEVTFNLDFWEIVKERPL
jgi:hypothetical protein